jgi:hypothetical protein
LELDIDAAASVQRCECFEIHRSRKEASARRVACARRKYIRLRLASATLCSNRVKDILR